MRDRVTQFLNGQIPLEVLDQQDLNEVVELLFDAIVTQKKHQLPASVHEQHDTIQ